MNELTNLKQFIRNKQSYCPQLGYEVGYQEAVQEILTEIKRLENKEHQCTWRYDWDRDGYDTDCGGAWNLDEGTPSDNGMLFCPLCGLELKEIIEIEE